MIVYDLGNISDWLTSIGTISAVIVALYLSRKDEKPRARVKATYGYGVSGDGRTMKLPHYLSIQIVNTGKVPIHLAECTIQMNRFSKKRMVFIDELYEDLVPDFEFFQRYYNYIDNAYNFLWSKWIYNH